MRTSMIILVVLMVNTMGYAQMTPAKMIPPEVHQKVNIRAPADVVWDYLLKFDNIAEFGNQIISENKVVGIGRNAFREVTFRNGTVRSEELAILAPDLKKMGIKVLNPSKEYSRYFYYFEIKKTGGSKCKVSLKAYYGLHDEKMKSTIKKEVTKEFTELLEGLKKHFES